MHRGAITIGGEDAADEFKALFRKIANLAPAPPGLGSAKR